jgi:hypothetical protein
MVSACVTAIWETIITFVLWSPPANDCDHGIQFVPIDFAISLTECLGDTFHFDMGEGARRSRPKLVRPKFFGVQSIPTWMGGAPS